jgi:hypothetical protein
VSAFKPALAIVLLLGAGTAVVAEDGDRFVGRVVLEWVDRPGNAPPELRLREHVGFQEFDDTAWFARRGENVDGSSLPPAFRSMFGSPFTGRYRIASILHDFYADNQREPWKDVHRMFYKVSVRAGVDETEAKAMYMVLYAQGPRWEVARSRCYGSCHGGSEALVWRPVTRESALRPIAEWIRQTNPTLDEIDRRAHAAISRPGPHLFAQGREE